MNYILNLPSDSSYKHFPDNKISSYSVKLETPIQLNGHDGWEVALLEIYYPSKWNSETSSVFYVYTPGLIDLRHVGHVKTPLIRQFIPPPMDTSDKVYIRNREFTTPHYVTVQNGLWYLDTLTVLIADEQGQPVIFMDGKVSLTLHLRAKKDYL